MAAVLRRRAYLVVAAGVALSGCATTSALNEVKMQTLQQQERIRTLEATCRLLEERSKSQELRLEQVSKLPAGLESDVAAVRGYAREVEKKVTDFREVLAKQLDLQNSHITQVKTSYGNVLQQQTQMVETMSKTLETAFGELKASIIKSLEELKKAIPTSDATVPPPPALPPNLKETPAPPTPPTVK